MHDIMIYNSKRQTAYLTTRMPGSSYGGPVLRVNGENLGPADSVDAYGQKFTAAELVYVAAKIRMPRRDLEICRRFLAQWPEGPQL